jgi:quercetin dioxygenase-like cupin family protein
MNPLVNVVEIAALPVRRAPIANGPSVRALPTACGNTDTTSNDGVGVSCGAAVALLQVSLPAGTGMPEHDHGPSAVTLIPLSGRVQLGHHSNQRVLGSGMVAFIDVGERVSLSNPHTEHAALLAVITPADFAAAVSSWPESTGCVD